MKNTGAHGYVHASTVARSLEEAQRPAGAAGDEFPRMLYRAAEQRIVQDADEEKCRESEGFSRTAPLPNPTYPHWYCERPLVLGGTKVYDLRSVQINSTEEEQQFLAVVSRKDWMLDAVTPHWGARGVSLETLTREHKEVVKHLIDRDLLEIDD